MLEVENYFYTEMEFYGVNCAIQYKTPSFTSIFEVIFMWILKEKFLDAGIQDECTSISIELRKMMKSIKFEEMSEPDDESDKHI